jgi:hypothetical protein
LKKIELNSLPTDNPLKLGHTPTGRLEFAALRCRPLARQRLGLRRSATPRTKTAGSMSVTPFVEQLPVNAELDAQRPDRLASLDPFERPQLEVPAEGPDRWLCHQFSF